MATILNGESTYPAHDNGLAPGEPLLTGLSLIHRPREERWPLRRTFLFAVVISTLAWGAIITTAIRVL